MAKLVAFYSRADENYFGGQYRYIEVGNTEKVANMISEITGADLFKIEQKEAYSADYQECVAEAKRDYQENNPRKQCGQCEKCSRKVVEIIPKSYHNS